MGRVKLAMKLGMKVGRRMQKLGRRMQKLVGWEMMKSVVWKLVSLMIVWEMLLVRSHR